MPWAVRTKSDIIAAGSIIKTLEVSIHAFSIDNILLSHRDPLGRRKGL